jgi:peptidoglycan/LPS O-acetylase OafA/YrhL
MPSTITSKRLPELDALRGVAVTLVVSLHLTTQNDQAQSIFKLGATGVDLFFVISGFVILLTLEKTKSWQDFIVSRFTRLYPAYWLSVTVTTILIVVKDVVFTEPSLNMTSRFLANLTMFQSYFKIRNLDGTYWTLQVEMLFYLFMLVVFSAKSLKKIEIISSITLLLIVAYHLLLNTKFQGLHTTLSYYLPLLNHFPLFFAGILFYKMKFDRVNPTRYCLVVLCFILQYFLFFDGGYSQYYVSQAEYAFMLVIYFNLFILYTNNYLGFIVNKVTLFLGSISYSLYLLHNYIGREFIIPKLVEYAHLNFWIAALGIALPLTIVSALLANKYVEQPIMDYVRTQYKSKNIST